MVHGDPGSHGTRSRIAGARARQPFGAGGALKGCTVSGLILLLVGGCGVWGGGGGEFLKEGRRELKAGAYRDALERFRAAVGQAPSSATAHTERGEVAELLGEFDEAMEAFDTAARLAPSATRFFRVATLADRMGYTAEAVEWLRAALAASPESRSRSGIERLTNLLQGPRVSREEVAERLFHVLVEAGDRDGALRLARGEGWVRDGADYCEDPVAPLSNDTEALLAMLLHPASAECVLSAGKGFTEGGLVRLARLALNDRVRNSANLRVRAEAATFLRNRLPAQDPAKLAESLNVVGYTLQFRSGKPQEAMRAYQKAIAADPAFTWPYSNMGLLFAREGQDEQAIEWYRKALAVNPNHWNALRNLGEGLWALRRYEEALPVFRQAIAMDPASAQAHAGAGWVLINLGSDAEGIGELLAANRLDPSLRSVREGLNNKLGVDARRGPTPSTAW